MRRAQKRSRLELYLDVDVGLICGSQPVRDDIKHDIMKMRSWNTDQGLRELIHTKH